MIAFNIALRQCHLHRLYRLIVFIGVSHSDWTLVSAKTECKSDDESLKWYLDSVDECADYCKNKFGCNFFDFGYGSKKGRCYMEYTTSAACPEGFETDKYYFYALNSKYKVDNPWPGLLGLSSAQFKVFNTKLPIYHLYAYNTHAELHL